MGSLGKATVLLVCDHTPDPLVVRALTGDDRGARVVSHAEFSAEHSITDDISAIVLLMSHDHALLALRDLKADPRIATMPVIVLLASPCHDTRIGALDTGAFACLARPYPISELRARIRSAIDLGGRVAALARNCRVDPLTSLWNRMHFQEHLEAALSTARRTRAPLTVALADLDHFKKLNDTFGHVAGDEALRAFARVLLAGIRAGDTACRYGGEEFAIILPGTDLQHATDVCARIRRATEAVKIEGFPDARITVSFGLAAQGYDGRDTPEAWIDAADRALYSAKNAGRNRIHCYSGKPSEGPAPTMRKAG